MLVANRERMAMILKDPARSWATMRSQTFSRQANPSRGNDTGIWLSMADVRNSCKCPARAVGSFEEETSW